MSKPVINWSGRRFRLDKNEDTTHFIEVVNISIRDSMATIIIRKGAENKEVTLSLDHLVSIGFINLDALIPYCK